MLYIATCYIPYTILLFFCMLVFPALSFFPSLVATPVLATTIPIVSVFFIDIFALILFKFNVYHRPEILMLTLIFGAMAFFRVRLFIKKSKLSWQKNDIYLLIINASLLLPLIAFSGLSAFMTDDALQSWNYWALHYLFGSKPDTLGYPPFFSVLISYAYQILGNIDYQGPIKALFVIFPFTILNALAFSTEKTSRYFVLFLALAIISIFPGFLSFDFYKFYSRGYADPMLAACIAASLLIFLHYLKNNQSDYLIVAAICGVTAALSKQPGLLWACISMPLLLCLKMLWEKKIDYLSCFTIAFLLIIPFCWLVTDGSHFYNNSGVLNASLHQTNVTMAVMFKTLWYSIIKYFILQPTFLLLFAFAALAAYQDKYKFTIFLVFILPMTLLWFIFGAYDIRLGLYILVSAALLVASENYFHIQIFSKLNLQKISNAFVLSGAVAFGIFSITNQVNPHINVLHHIYPLNAGLSNLYRYYGDQAPFIYKQIYNHKNIRIWAPNRMAAGIFYGHNPVVTENNPKVLSSIKNSRADYVALAFCDHHLWDCDAIQELKEVHPAVLKPILIGSNHYQYYLYRVIKT